MTARSRVVATGLPAGAVSSAATRELTDGWSLLRSDPGAVASPAGLPGTGWESARAPGTVALAVGPDDPDRHPDYDASDWWYKGSFEAAATTRPTRTRLRFDGLATLAEVWLNGEPILSTGNMFLSHEVDVTDLVSRENEIAIAFRSLGTALSERRPRPRWKTRLVDEQRLRWFRTTLLGRIPGWTPAIRPVGPWRSIWLEVVSALDLVSLDVRPGMTDGRCHVDVRAEISPLDAAAAPSAARLMVGETAYDLELPNGDGVRTVRGRAEVEGAALWWPATHGDPALHDCALELESPEGTVSIDCGRIGFRDVRVDGQGGDVRFVVNGEPVFCRGSCWTSADIVSLVGTDERVRRTLGLIAEGGANMIRVGGTMVYETDAFYRVCDELGLMVWQDFMFANMDYPLDDADFAHEVHTEAVQQLTRLSRHPCVAAWCGGSEVQQQAAMLGAPRELWAHEFFSRTLADLVAEHGQDAPYWSSTPTGGVLPFEVGEGLAHYFGVGAYRRPLEDARLAGVRFTPECLGFSNVPGDANLAKLTAGGAVPPHHPAWKAGVPRDAGAGWDFEDVRDHYLELLYGVDAVRLRSENLPRYIALSRVVTGEVLAHVFGEWRGDDRCGGGLSWLLGDLRPGAGWGLIDSDGEPKAVYHHLRRAWAPRCVRLLDRGLDGLSALVVNEDAEPLEAILEVLIVAEGSRIVADAADAVELPGRSSHRTTVEEQLGYFVDATYSYRFGPPPHEAVVARLVTSDAASVISEDVYRPARDRMTPAPAPHAEARSRADGRVEITLRSDHLIYDVRLDARGFRVSDTHFCLTPGRDRRVDFTPLPGAERPFSGYLEALNLSKPLRLPDPA